MPDAFISTITCWSHLTLIEDILWVFCPTIQFLATTNCQPWAGVLDAFISTILAGVGSTLTEDILWVFCLIIQFLATTSCHLPLPLRHAVKPRFTGFLPLDNDSTALWWSLMSSGSFDSRTGTNTVPYKSAWVPILCNPLIWTSVPSYSFRSFPVCSLLHTGINFNNIFMWAVTIYFSSPKRFFKSSIVVP